MTSSGTIIIYQTNAKISQTKRARRAAEAA